MILKAEIHVFSHLPLKTPYPRNFRSFGSVKLAALANFRWSVFGTKAKRPAGNRSAQLPPLLLPFLLLFFFFWYNVQLTGGL